MSRLGDLVTMPLPTKWGPVVMPPNANTTIAAVAPSGQYFLIINGTPYPASLLQSGVLQVSGPATQLPAGTQPISQIQQNGYPTQPGGPQATLPIPGGSGLQVPYPSVVTPPTGSPQNWSPAPILRDSMLPPALQRTNPLVRQYAWKQNIWDARLIRESQAWGWIRAHGGLKSRCRIPELGAPVYDSPPWITMPSQGEKFEQMFGQPLTAFQTGGGAFTGLDVVIGQFVVPNGYDGAINRVVFRFEGTGYTDFSGSIIWRVLVNNRYCRNLGNVINTFGDLATAFSVPGSDNIRLVSQQTVTLLANIPLGSPVGGGPVIAGAFGWFYPRR